MRQADPDSTRDAELGRVADELFAKSVEMIRLISRAQDLLGSPAVRELNASLKRRHPAPVPFEPAAISARLAALREHLGLTPAEMAEKLSMTEGAYREWERPGKRQWSSLRFPLKVSKATGVSIEWLRGDRASAVPQADNGHPLPRLRPRPRVIEGGRP